MCGCRDDDAKAASDSKGRVTDCAAGLALAYGVCSDDTFVDATDPDAAPKFWFLDTCPATCGVCRRE